MSGLQALPCRLRNDYLFIFALTMEIQNSYIYIYMYILSHCALAILQFIIVSQYKCYGYLFDGMNMLALNYSKQKRMLNGAALNSCTYLSPIHYVA